MFIKQQEYITLNPDLNLNIVYINNIVLMSKSYTMLCLMSFLIQFLGFSFAYCYCRAAAEKTVLQYELVCQCRTAFVRKALFLYVLHDKTA